MEISLTGANFGLLGGLIILGLLLFLLRGLLNGIAILVILAVVAPVFGVGFLGSLDTAGLGSRAQLTAAEGTLLQAYQDKAGFTDSEVGPAYRLLNKARSQGVTALTAREMTQYGRYQAKDARLTREERTHFLQLLRKREAAQGGFSQKDALDMIRLLQKADISGPEYQRYMSLFQTRMNRIATGQRLAAAQNLELAALDKRLNDNLSGAEADTLRELYLKQNPRAIGGGGLTSSLIGYSKTILDWVFRLFQSRRHPAAGRRAGNHGDTLNRQPKPPPIPTGPAQPRPGPERQQPRRPRPIHPTRLSLRQESTPTHEPPPFARPLRPVPAPERQAAGPALGERSDHRRPGRRTLDRAAGGTGRPAGIGSGDRPAAEPPDRTAGPRRPGIPEVPWPAAIRNCPPNCRPAGSAPSAPSCSLTSSAGPPPDGWPESAKADPPELS